MPKSQKKQIIKQKKDNDISFQFKIGNPLKIILLSIIIIITVLLPLYYVQYADSINKVYSFPVDDSWIHLQFAKNLAEYGSFSYFKNEQVTAGTTSPVYMFIIAAGFFITNNEYWLSFIIGILFFAIGVFYFYRLGKITFVNDNWLAFAAALLLAIDKRLNLISVSGMETTMYIFLLIACFYYYRKRNASGFAVTLGLTLWARPDAVVFIAVVLIDYIYLLYCKKHQKKANEKYELFNNTDMVKMGVIAGAIIALYFIMNLILSGTLLPNTYNAKLTYYTPELRSRADFLKYEVWGYFTESAYVLVIVPFIIALIKIITDTFKLKYNPYMAMAVFIFGLIFIYWFKMPYSHRFGRYLMPVYPFYFLLFLYGSRILFKYFAKYLSTKKIANALNVVLIISAIVYFVFAYADYREMYQDQTRHIYIRNVLTGKWLKDNTPEGSIVATHDAGAIAFYSGRKIVDVVGLINPEFTKKIHDKDFSVFVEEQMKKMNVSYVAFIKEWFQVTNQTPLFTAGDKGSELFEVYRYDPKKTHILSIEVNSTLRYGIELLQQKQYQMANNYLNRVYMTDTNSALTLYFLAYSNVFLRDEVNAERNLIKSLRIYPDNRDAAILLGSIYNAQKRNSDAKNVMNRYLELVPGDTVAAAFLNKLNDTLSTQ